MYSSVSSFCSRVGSFVGTPLQFPERAQSSLLSLFNRRVNSSSQNSQEFVVNAKVLETSFDTELILSGLGKEHLKTSAPPPPQYVPDHYGEVMKNPSLVFHGIGLDFSKVSSILDHGILSANAAEEKKVDIAYTYGSKESGPFFNGKECISLARSLNYNEGSDRQHPSFKAYVQTGISFVIDTDNIKKSSKSDRDRPFFADECFGVRAIDPSEIKGVMIPEEVLDLPLESVDFVTVSVGSVDSFHDRCFNMYEYVTEKTGYKDLELLVIIAKPCSDENDKKIYAKKINDFVCQAFRSTGKPTFRDVLREVIPSQILVYNSEGHEIDL